VARIADAAAVGTALVQRVAQHVDADGKARPGLVDAVLTDVRALAQGVRSARLLAAPPARSGGAS
jgi:tryptophan synthase alpha chain